MKHTFSITGLLLVALLFINCNNNTGKKEEESLAAPVEHESAAPEEIQNQKVQDSSLSETMAEGKKVYDQKCMVCHQSSGGGVPNMNPPLQSTEYVLGEKARIISIVLNGSSAGLEVKGRTYSNNMPGFSEDLNDSQIASVLTYVRNSFGNKASEVSEEEVRAVRDSIKGS